MMRKIMTRRVVPALGLAAAVLAVAACSSSSSSSTSTATSSAPAAGATSSAPATSSASGGSLLASTIGGNQVVTNTAGRTLYWFAPDTPTTSKCSGSCATYWPPVKGPATAGSGVTGTIGEITRSDGTQQATYDGHPLYTYAGDSAPARTRATT